ncbi:PLP-dependent aminotransferase family protein [Rhizobium cremeum]|uniref:MocR-like pyridoxine biosynthesis transcription factor PdxR n=1 Tax=Rhizobium cremeum TaxID=2813827 RepID=UPI000DE1720A|nr:PLP-dependent aminotransferase family protein [Rhizobium cremeum]MCJ7995187.1 PLP-dependent aminotransferase family protein [Rhizobium cremeum]MCJ8000501.1 PLP-dependent aminotransferase family protein [Rhizobium cremeum]
MSKVKTNSADWSALIPVLPDDGPHTAALYRVIRRLIETGTIAPGTKLPPTRDLSARLKVSRGSAVAAFEMLIADGFAEARTGAGTFVAAQVPVLRAPDTVVEAAGDIAPPLPGTLGIATADARTLKTFRALMSWHLARPGFEHFHYGDPRGSADLREAVATYLRTARGVRCDGASVVITHGTQQALDLFIRSALQPGDGVWIEDPCYPMARTAFAEAGMRLSGIPVDAEGMDPVAGENLMPSARAVYVTPSHQFPLGVTMTMRRRLALIDWARRNDAWIIEDDYDSEFRYAGPPLTSLQGMDDTGHVIYIGTFSKALFPGLRMGYMVAPPSLRERIVALKSRTDRFPPTLAEAALTDLLREGHFAAHLRRTRRRSKVARDELVAGLLSNPRAGIEVETPDQGLHLIARLPTGAEDTAMVEKARAAGLGVRALSAMSVSGTPRQGLVIGFSGFGGEALREAATRFVATL